MRAFTIALALSAAAAAFARQRSVAITVDDLPGAGGEKLLNSFQKHNVPVTGFVIRTRAEGTTALRAWTERGFDLGNHSYSHPDFNDLSVEQIENEIVHGEAGNTARFFRFPFNHTGDTREKHDAIAAFLRQRGYRVAVCTIDTSDYVFNNAYVRMLARKDAASARRLRTDYLAYTSVEIDYYAGLNRKVLGYEPPEVMLLHDNRLNGDVIDEVLKNFEDKHYRFVSLSEAQSDVAYRTADAWVTKYGPMWGYRWAKERNVIVNGSLETDPPKWITEYGKP